MTNAERLDQELKRVLEAAAGHGHASVELPQLKQTQSSSWPWQVPQAPAYTSDHAPAPQQ